MAENKKRRRGAHRPPRQKPTLADKARALFDAFLALPREKRIGLICASVAAAALIAVTVWISLPHPRALQRTENGDFYDPKSGVTYTLAPMSYEPEAWKKAVWGKCGEDELHAVSGLDPARYLCTVEGGVGVLWCSDDIALPALDGFDAEKIIVCTETETVMALKTVERKDHVTAVVEAFLDGASEGELPEASRNLSLKLTSRRYPGLFYNLSYLECADGNYLYERESAGLVNVGSLLLWYINRSGMEQDENTLIGDAPTAALTTSPESDESESEDGEETA